jgi:hypothetical protein
MFVHWRGCHNLHTCSFDTLNPFSCQTGSDSIVYRNAAVGSYYIGINAFGVSASYVVLAHLDCPSRNSAVILTDGQPINGHVDRGTSRFYNITLSDLSRDLTISCTRRSGDPDMCVYVCFAMLAARYFLRALFFPCVATHSLSSFSLPLLLAHAATCRPTLPTPVRRPARSGARCSRAPICSPSRTLTFAPCAPSAVRARLPLVSLASPTPTLRLRPRRRPDSCV